MIQFQKLRLSGFKSFVDKTELEIGSGLTGIVGPNGCGKSNLVEALRWVMGENSAKRMRGGGMEDVIFNGTSNRPQRNFAEVSLLIDNKARAAPPSYNGNDEIEVTRRIERDQGSLYKINGKTCRARDVQMLFADTVTGANSPALVSQGRVTAMINAKPHERRLVLEESAGVAGLYVRRHEAELRLRAADQNLQRVQDLVGSMENRYNALKKQARQAQKYKNLSTQIRELDSTIAYLEWRILLRKIEEARRAFAQAESRVATHMTTVTQLTRTQTQQAEDLPALRKAEAEAAAALQAHRFKLQSLEEQERDWKSQLEEARVQYEGAQSDKAHEQNLLSESLAVLEKLEEENRILSESRRNEDSDLDQKKAIKADLEVKVLALEADYESFMQKTAETRAARQRIEQQIAADKSRLLVAQERKEKLTEDLNRARVRFENSADLDSIKTGILSLEAETAAMREQIEGDESALIQTRAALDSARQEKDIAEKTKAEIDSEIKALERILTADTQYKFKPVLEEIRPAKGFEKALSRALGDTLMASRDSNAPAVWMDENPQTASIPVPSLPQGVRPLQPHVKAPDYLRRSLQFIGMVETDEEGTKAAEFLLPGQSIVSVEGAYWRWDGFHIKQTASDRHAIQLQQKNRLDDLRRTQPESDAASHNAGEKTRTLQEEQATRQRGLDSLRVDLRRKESELSSKQSELSRLTESRTNLFADIATLEESLRRTDEDMGLYSGSIANHAQELERYDEGMMASHAAAVDKLREQLSQARDSYNQAVRSLDMLQQEQSRRMARLHAIADERLSHQNRSIRSRERVKSLDGRESTLFEKITTLKANPRTREEDKTRLLDSIAQYEKQRDTAADSLARVEAELAQTSRALKQAESSLMDAREERAHAQALVSSGQEQLAEVVAAIHEQFDHSPIELKTAATAATFSDDEDSPLPALEPLKSSREKLTRERDQIGPVNLRAEEEAEALDAEMGVIFRERGDLIQAITELREGIQKLNKEARERLTAAFDVVNGHFQTLFVKLFNGGSAHLKLVESDDPLESGLEIFAQPPGKTLQSLSLLSGGEQTLASIALIFAMFLTTPSPICVLDEIDAPLDDANVDRVCNLLDDLAARGETRFLVITHHRLTMARMDRLYGVTMAERGISQLVSVDLHAQLDLLEAA